MSRCVIYASNITCRGSGGVLRRPAGSARGRSPLASAQQHTVPFDSTAGAGWRHLPCAGGGKGGSPPLHPRPGDIAPWNPKSRWSYRSRQARMAMSTDASLVILRSEHTRAMRRCRNRAPNLMCRGSGGVLRRPVGSARGRATSHARSAICHSIVQHVQNDGCAHAAQTVGQRSSASINLGVQYWPTRSSANEH